MSVDEKGHGKSKLQVINESMQTPYLEKITSQKMRICDNPKVKASGERSLVRSTTKVIKYKDVLAMLKELNSCKYR